MAPSDVGSVIPNCTLATDEPQGEDEQMRRVATSAGRQRVVVVGGGEPGHGQLMQAHALQVAQMVGVQRSLVCVCEELSKPSLQPHHTRGYRLLLIIEQLS